MTLSKIVSRVLLSFALIGSVVFAAAPAVSAIDPFQGIRSQCGRASDSAVCQTQASDDPLVGTIRKVTLIIGSLAGAVAVIAMVLAGIRYISSGGDPDQISRAKNTIIYGAIGLIVIVLGQVIINAILNRI